MAESADGGRAGAVARVASRGAAGRALTWLRGGLAPEVTRSLRRHGWTVRPVRGTPPQAADLLADLRADVVVLSVGDAADDRPLLLAEAYRDGGGAAEIVFLASTDSEAQRRWAATITPYWYRWPIAAQSLALLLDRVRERGRRARPRRGAAGAVRHVTIRLWESVELDGCNIYLGAAERNFLFTLAAAEGRRVSKLDEVEAGPGRRVVATECRRRLGRRLGPELTELLIPVLRGEPYRFREPLEVEAACLAEPGRHVPTRLRIIGRASVRTSYSARLEALA